MHIMQSRRDFLATLSAAGTARVVCTQPSLADVGPPEITTIRLSPDANICLAPGYIAEDLLRVEGFIDISYLADTSATRSRAATSTWSSIPPSRSSRTWTPAGRSHRWRASIPAATSCLRTRRSRRSAT